MKCINCNQEIPDTSNTCPFCNNKVEPIVSAAEAMGITNNVIPNTPTDYVLPKDQAAIDTTNIPAPPTMDQVQPQNIPAPPTMDEPVQPSVPQRTEEVVNPNVATPTEVLEDKGIPAPPKPGAAPEVNPNLLSMQNVDLNANPMASSIDLTKSGERLASTAIHGEKEEEAIKNKKKARIILIVFIILLVLFGLGIYFYISQYTTADKRIDRAVDSLFSFTNSFTNSKIESGSGSYSLSFTSNKNSEELTIEANGKYGYDLPSKKIDLITNFTKYNHNGDLLDEELNTELYLESNRAYLLLQNFDTKYFYTDIDNSKAVIEDIESRFDNPDKLLLFAIVNNLYGNGLENFSKSYKKYLDNISQNSINYTSIISGLKTALKEGIKSAPHSQKFEGNKNVIRISLNREDIVRNIYKTMLSSIKNNKGVYTELTKLYGGNENDFYNDLNDWISNQTYQAINANITLVTDPFKNNLISLSFPYVLGEDIYMVTITPQGSGYKIVAKHDNKEVLNLVYSKKSSKQSETETKNYSLKGTIYNNDVANNIELNIEVVKDIVPKKVNVVTRNSIDYQYLTENDFNELSNKIKEFGNLGVVFSTYYKGVIPVETPVETEGVNE